MMIVRRLHLAGAPDRNRKDETAASEASSEKGRGDDEPASWIAIYRGFDPVEVRILADFLAREGIPVRLRQEAAGSAIPVNFGLLGGSRSWPPCPWPNALSLCWTS